MDWFFAAVKWAYEKIKLHLVVNLIILVIIALVIMNTEGLIKCVCINLPRMIKAELFPRVPPLTVEVSQEIKDVCTPTTCRRMFKWLEEMAIFRGEYQIFQLHNEKAK